MTVIPLKRQFIADASGQPVGVILPLSEFALVKDVLDQKLESATAAKLAQIKQAATDPLFLTDLRDTMSAFAGTDADWWESHA
jgi:hypothetical protein